AGPSADGCPPWGDHEGRPYGARIRSAKIEAFQKQPPRMPMRRIVVDAMGTDLAPQAEVEGALLAAREGLAQIILVGPEERLKRELGRHGESVSRRSIEIVHASQSITMEDAAAKSFRRKRDSSIRVAARLVREGQADGLISAGNTGAVMATLKIVLGVLAGVDRPALAA